jgi:hypothetical protein
MRLHRPVLAALALGTILPVTAASAATGVVAAGSAVSTATIATIAVGDLVAGETVVPGHAISVATLTATAQTLTSAAPAVSFVPVTVDGVQSGAVTVTPANSPTTVGGVTTAALPGNVLSATSPVATLTAAKPASGPTSALSASLGTIKVLGLPIAMNGSLKVGSATDVSHANAGKTLSVKNVSFPSIGALLAALGIDVTKLPVATLTALVEELPLIIGATTLAAFDAASAAVTAADDAYTGAQGDAADAAADLATKTTAFDSELSGADLTGIVFTGSGVTDPGPLGHLDHTDWDTLGADGNTVGQAVQDAILLLNDTTFGAAAAAYEAAKIVLADAQAQLGPLFSTLSGAIATLAGIVSDVLDGTPLLSIGAIEVGTTAAVGSTKAAKVTGYVSGLKVMGLDVLGVLTGNTKLDVAKLAGTTASQVNSLVNALTTTLSEILSSATGATGLIVPAPLVQVLTKSTHTGTDGAFGTADVTLNALSVSMGTVEVPRVYALGQQVSIISLTPKAVLPAIRTAPFSVKLGTITEAARYRAASTPTTPGNGNELPATGSPYGLAIVAVVGAGLAIGTRRHLRAVRA